MPPRHRGEVGYGDFGSSLRDLPRLRDTRRHRQSSWDITGGNDDRLVVRPGEVATIADIQGAGTINHVWMTVSPLHQIDNDAPDRDYLRRLVLRIWWDDASEPSVLVPLGDFFGVGHARTANFASLPLQMAPQNGRGMTSFFHMPFASRARMEILSECEAEPMRVYFYVDYEMFDRLEPGIGLFHASWNRENPTDGIDPAGLTSQEFLSGGQNLDGDGNYVALDTRGRGHYVGCVLNITNLRHTTQWNWYGEGDDMIFIDDEPWPPRLHGTGIEDYFGAAWCPTQSYSAPYQGITLPGGDNFAGQISLYRFHVEDPIPFERSIRVTFEHGHANHRSDDLSSTAYWYAEAPTPALGLPPVADRLPRSG